MIENAKSRPVLFVFIVYIICWIFRAIEYFIIRTDQTIMGEAFIHKLAGIALLAVVLNALGYKWQDIGFRIDKFVRGTGLGILLGGVVFILAYSIEMMIQTQAGNSPTLSFYVTSYAIGGNRDLQGGTMLLLFCLVGNLINVVMEEGVFRGLMCKITEQKHSFWFACIFSSLLFGLWHIAQPLRNVMDGEQSVMGAVMSSILLVGTSALLGVQYCMLRKITGSLWAGMAAHFINNAAINLLHVTTTSGVDELQIMRITIAQSVSFVIVLIFYVANTRKKSKDEFWLLEA